MANVVSMPQIGISEESAILAQWHVKKGDSVTVGDTLFSSETGKSAFDIASEFAGVVLEILVPEGEEVLIKTPVCVIGEAGEKYESAASAPVAKAEAAPAANPAVAPVAQAAPVAAVPAERHEGTGVSPRARALAEKADVDAMQANPTGPEGRIIERDVRALIESGVGRAAAASTAAVGTAAVAASAPVAAYEDKPLSTMRKIISKNMMNSLQTTAQLTHTAGFDATAIQQYRVLCKNDAELSGVTLTDMILFAVTRTLADFPDLNAWMQGDSMRYFADVNLAVAVDTDRGLMVPVLFGASKMSLLAISKALKGVAQGCKDGTISPDLLTGGSFPVSNLGMFGIEHFTPILNAPQTGILGVNTITEHVRTKADGSIEVYPRMTVSLTYDHRAVDGAPASKFLQTLCKNLEKFPALLAK